MHPYRTGEPADDHPTGASHDRWVHWMLLGLGAAPVASALVRHDPWGAEPSVGLLAVLFAGRPLAAHYGRALYRALRG